MLKSLFSWIPSLKKNKEHKSNSITDANKLNILPTNVEPESSTKKEASIYNHIRDAIYEEVAIKFERAVLFVHVMEDTAGGFLIYNKTNASTYTYPEKFNNSIFTCENVWETERHNGNKNLWSAIIYIIDDAGARYELLYEDDFDVTDLLHREIGDEIKNKFFPNMTYKSSPLRPLCKRIVKPETRVPTNPYQ